MNIVSFRVGEMAVNCYFAICEKKAEAVIIDPGDDAQFLSEELEKRKIRPVSLVATHGHFDHVLAAFELQLIYDIPLYLNLKDKFLLDSMKESAEHFLRHPVQERPAQKIEDLNDGYILTAGDEKLSVIETPGHTPGGITLYSKTSNTVFVGDLLFAHGYLGRTDFSYSNTNQIISSLQKILSLPGRTIILPGHDEPSTVAIERTYHPVIDNSKVQ